MKTKKGNEEVVRVKKVRNEVEDEDELSSSFALCLQMGYVGESLLSLCRKVEV
jgi:hypothetical protein